jgi:hypothetical protein
MQTVRQPAGLVSAPQTVERPLHPSRQPSQQRRGTAVNGPTHYTEAEKSFTKAQQAASKADAASAVLHMQAAQFHASMALVAATALTVLDGASADAEEDSWRAAIFNNPIISNHKEN